MNKRYSIILDKKVHELLMALAKDNKVTQGEIIGRLLAEFIKKEKENE